MAQYFKIIKNSVKYWYIPLLIGLLFVGVAIYTFVSPLSSFVALSIVFTASFIISGISDISFALSNKDVLDNWGWTLALGIITLVMGVLLALRPEISMATLPLYVGFVVMFRSVSAISMAMDLKRHGIMDWGNLMILGVLGVIFSFILIWNPIFAGLSAVIWTGLAFLTIGAYGIFVAFKLKKLKDFPDKITDSLKQKIAEIDEEIKRVVKS